MMWPGNFIYCPGHGDASMPTYTNKSSLWDCMSWPLLRYATSDFSEERLIGRGPYGDVYKGAIGYYGHPIAVKKLHVTPGIYDELNCSNEIFSTMKLQHENVVRLVGRCYEEEEVVVQLDGKHIFAVAIHGAIFFEYLPNGSLDRYISDISSGLSWQTRYGIIKGVCEGLRYLHEGLKSPILHLNLKLSNILLDKNMIPKIGDSGMPRLAVEGNDLNTQSSIGTYGHMPPEFIEKQVTSKEFDIYSLGIIITKLVAGNELYSELGNISLEEFTELAHEKWRERVQENMKGRVVGGYCQQVKKCLDIAFKCVEVDRHKRPAISDIIQTLNKTETLIQGLEQLHVHPLELDFPFMLRVPRKKNCIVSSSCSLDLKNRGDDSVAFMLVANSPWRYLTKEPLCGIVPPGSTYTLTLTMLNKKEPLSTDSGDFFTLYSLEVTIYDIPLLCDNNQDSAVSPYEKFFKKAEMNSEEVQEVTLKVLCCQQADDKGTCSSEIITTPDAQQVSSIDVHPMEPWVMITDQHGRIRIWNYHTMETLNFFRLEAYEPVYVAKFITREKWLVAGDLRGHIVVYNYETNDVQSFRAHLNYITTLAVHPTSPFVLSSSEDGYDGPVIKLWDWNNSKKKLWDWDDRWKCTREFWGHTGRVTQVSFDPVNNDSFASASLDGSVKIWSICSDDPNNITTLKLNGPAESLLCVDFFTHDNRQHLITGSGTAQIWDLRITQGCVYELDGHEKDISAVHLHPELPILITGSLDGTVRTWNTTTYVPENIIDFNLGAVYAFGCIKGSRRIVVGCHRGIATVEIPLP